MARKAENFRPWWTKLLTAEGPEGARYTIIIRPVGVPDTVPAGGAVLEFSLGYVWHLVRHRGQWQVELHRASRLRDIVRGSGFLPWVVVGSGSRATVVRMAARIKEQVEAGELRLDD